MENEIKVNEFVRTRYGEIAKVIEFKDELILDTVIKFNGIYREYLNDDELDFIVKHSPNLIDLIQCGDYVNGYIVRRTYLDGEIHYIKLGKQITGNRTYNDDIKTVVTREQFESISYKVKE